MGARGPPGRSSVRMRLFFPAALYSAESSFSSAMPSAWKLPSVSGWALVMTVTFTLRRLVKSGVVVKGEERGMYIKVSYI